MLRIKTAGFEEYLDSANGAWIKCLILGEHGVGKTPSAARWPEPIIADCERGVMSVASLGTPYATITTSADMEELLEFLRRDSLLPNDKRKYRTVIIDTIDSYQRLLVSERLRAERKESLSGWADWGWLGGKGGQLIEKLLNLPINVVVNMHVKDKRDDDGESTILIKDNPLKGDLSDTIYRDFDLIGLMEKSYVSEGGERVLKRQIRWHSEPKYPMLRDRSGKLPRFTDIDFTEDDYKRIFATITDGLDDLPTSRTLEELGTALVTHVVAPDEPGGPIEDLKLPKDPPAKKAVAKKAVKKAAPKVEATVNKAEQGTPVDVPESEDPWKPEQQAVTLVTEKLGGEVVDEQAEAAEQVEVEARATVVELEKPAEEAGPTCGTVTSGLDGNPGLGCGKVLTAENAVKRHMAQLRTKTNLCDQCFLDWRESH